MPVKIDPLIIEELASINLVIWEAKHPKLLVWNEAKGKHTPREQKDWVVVTLAGPGVEEARGGAPTLRAAIDTALVHSGLYTRVTGLRGALLRVERAMWDLDRCYAEARFREAYGDDEDDIPF